MLSQHLFIERGFRTLALGALTVLALSSCAGVQGDRSSRHASPAAILDEAVRLQKQAGSPTWNTDRYVVQHLRAAELAWRERPNASCSVAANKILSTSTAALSVALVPHIQSGGTRTYSYDGHDFRLTLPRKREPGEISPLAFESLKSASIVPHALLKQWQSVSGVGAPLAAKWKIPANPELAKYVPKRGFIMPVTGLLTFPTPSHPGQNHEASLVFLDPTVLKQVSILGKREPLAADFSAPIVDRTRDIREVLLALRGLVHPEAYSDHLALLQPYDPKRIPVVLVHGLMSHPRMWRNVINKLMADPAINGKIQFWVYYYPTGWPISYSAMRFREGLAGINKVVGKHRKILLVGHSMGGLLCRMQVINTGDVFARMSLPKEKWNAFQHLAGSHIIKRSVVFRANPDVNRVVFICTPHRGSTLADWSLATWATKLIRLPSQITSSAIDFIPNLATHPETYSSISRLSPKNPLYKMLEQLPILAPHHSIIGDRGRGDSPHSSDGVVAYWSSHMDSAESELIVPGDHGAFDTPQAIDELDRIVKMEAAKK